MTIHRHSVSWTVVEVLDGCGVYRHGRAWNPGEQLELEPGDAAWLAQRGLVTVLERRVTGPKAMYV